MPVVYPNTKESFERGLPMLEAAGVNLKSGRIAEYLQFLEDLRNPSKEWPDADYYVRTWAEVHETVFVLDALRANSITAPTKLLQMAFSGPAVPTHEPDSDKSRNYLLHLRVAFYFAALGYTISLGEDADLVASKGKRLFFVECKRVYSEKKVQRRVKEAYEQARKRLDGCGNRKARALIWIDPSPIMLRRNFFYSAYSVEGARQAVRYDLGQFLGEFVGDNLGLRDRRVIGMIFQIVWPCRIGEKNRVQAGFTSIVAPTRTARFWEIFFIRQFFQQLLTVESGSAG